MAAMQVGVQPGGFSSADCAPLEMGKPRAHMPPAMMMGVTEEKNRAWGMLVFSMPYTQEAKCRARAPPDSSISRPLSRACCFISAAPQEDAQMTP